MVAEDAFTSFGHKYLAARSSNFCSPRSRIRNHQSTNGGRMRQRDAGRAVLISSQRQIQSVRHKSAGIYRLTLRHHCQCRHDRRRTEENPRKFPCTALCPRPHHVHCFLLSLTSYLPVPLAREMTQMVYGGYLCSLGKAQVQRVDALSHVPGGCANAVEQNSYRDSRRVAWSSTSMWATAFKLLNTLGQQQEMVLVLTSRGDFTDIEKQRQ